MDYPSPTEAVLISILHRNGASVGRSLAREYYELEGRPLSYSTLYISLRRLELGGWVKKRPPLKGSDQRQRVFDLTHEGRQLSGDVHTLLIAIKDARSAKQRRG
jgi:DNA-binding PadR family transcriptional regulator